MAITIRPQASAQRPVATELVDAAHSSSSINDALVGCHDRWRREPKTESANEQQAANHHDHHDHAKHVPGKKPYEPAGLDGSSIQYL